MDNKNTWRKNNLKNISISMKLDRYAELEQIANDMNCKSVGTLFKTALEYCIDNNIDLSAYQKTLTSK